MVRTGARAAALQRLLIASGLVSAQPPPRPEVVGLPDTLRTEVMAVYRRLGGQGEPLLRPGTWDLAFRGDFVVELDEELHFNRYRAITLSTSWSADLPWVADYQRFCKRREAECRSAGSWGKRWTNASCERMFGQAGSPGDFTGSGAPRWKQRALYDALKDLAPTLDKGVRLARVSIYDSVEGTTIGQIVEERVRANPSAVREFVETRTAHGHIP
jgi:hypothetical protein